MKCSEIVAVLNVEKCTPTIVANFIAGLSNLMPKYNLWGALACSDAAGCNWLGFDLHSTHSAVDILPESLTAKYPDIDFSQKHIRKCPVSKRYMVLCPDMPHLTKNIVTALELSSSKKSKRNIMYGVCPTNLRMIEVVWIELGGATNQLQETRLTIHHFVKDAYSRMNVALAVQILSYSVVQMLEKALVDDDVVLTLKNKDMYRPLIYLCCYWNDLVDICNGRDGPHTPENGLERQHKLLSILKWFSQWKARHDKEVASGKKTDFNFFAAETWKCIQLLILSHVEMIQIYCIDQNLKINPRKTNTDPVEWHFGAARQQKGGSTSSLTMQQFDDAAFLSSVSNAAKYNIVGNNKSGAPENCSKTKKSNEHFVRRARY